MELPPQCNIIFIENHVSIWVIIGEHYYCFLLCISYFFQKIMRVYGLSLENSILFSSVFLIFFRKSCEYKGYHWRTGYCFLLCISYFFQKIMRVYGLSLENRILFSIVYFLVFSENHASIWVIIGEQHTVFYCVFHIVSPTHAGRIPERGLAQLDPRRVVRHVAILLRSND